MNMGMSELTIIPGRTLAVELKWLVDYCVSAVAPEPHQPQPDSPAAIAEEAGVTGGRRGGVGVGTSRRSDGTGSTGYIETRGQGGAGVSVTRTTVSDVKSIRARARAGYRLWGVGIKLRLRDSDDTARSCCRRGYARGRYYEVHPKRSRR